MAERGLVPYDAKAGTAREIAYQARTLEAGHGRDETVARLRVLVDVYVAHAVALRHDYRDARDSLMAVEYEAATASVLKRICR